MGGCGSGSWHRWNTKALVASCLTLDVRRFHQAGLLHPDGLPSSPVYQCSWQYDTGEQQASIGVQVGRDRVTLRYRYRDSDGEWQDVTESVSLSWTSCNYGGRRPWFRCPGVTNGVYCGRRVSKLYIRQRYFVCRHCYRLVYPSQRVAVADRPMRRTQNIRMRLGGSGNLLEPFPRKPKGMHWQTYWRLWDKARKAETAHLGIMLRWLDRLEGARNK